MTRYDVFLSHSSQDSEAVSQLKDSLEAADILCWYSPHFITGGSIYTSTLEEAVSSSIAVVLYFSSDSASSPHVQRELIVALEAKKPVYVVAEGESDVVDIENLCASNVEKLYRLNTTSFSDIANDIIASNPNIRSAIKVRNFRARKYDLNGRFASWISRGKFDSAIDKIQEERVSELLGQPKSRSLSGIKLVFLSARTHAGSVAALRSAVEARGMECTYIDTNSIQTAELGSELIDSISSSDVAITIICAESRESFAMVSAIENAVNLRKTVIPIIIENTTLTKDFRYLLATRQRLNATRDTLSEKGDEIIASINESSAGKHNEKARSKEKRGLAAISCASVGCSGLITLLAIGAVALLKSLGLIGTDPMNFGYKFFGWSLAVMLIAVVGQSISERSKE